MNRRNIAAMAGLAFVAMRRAFAQTRTEPEQTKFPPAPGPSLQIIEASGAYRQVQLGPTLGLLNQSGVYTLNVVTATAAPVAQRLTLEPDGFTWKIPTPYSNPAVYRNGLRMLQALDYTIELDPVANTMKVRPTAAQGMKTTDVWVAA